VVLNFPSTAQVDVRRPPLSIGAQRAYRRIDMVVATLEHPYVPHMDPSDDLSSTLAR
jgi:hypothetical protein